MDESYVTQSNSIITDPLQLSTTCSYTLEFLAGNVNTSPEANSEVYVDASTTELVLDSSTYPCGCSVNTTYRLWVKYDHSAYSYVSSYVDFQVDWVDPCDPLDTFAAIPVTNPDDYYFTSHSPSAQMTATLFDVEPTYCSIAYTCSNTGPRTDMCSVVSGSSSGTFDVSNGNYAFGSNDIVSFPPGTYTFTITGTTDFSVQETNTFTLVLVNPCLSATLTINKPIAFDEPNGTLGSPDIAYEWEQYGANSIYSIDTLVDCGDVDVLFTSVDVTGPAIPFNDVRSSPNELTILQSFLPSGDQ